MTEMLILYCSSCGHVETRAGAGPLTPTEERGRCAEGRRGNPLTTGERAG